jgi:hypothetical protein
VAKKRQPGNVYWAHIESAFDSVDIYSGPSVFLANCNKLELRTVNLLAAHWCQSEVCNGGFHQFFHNSTGVLAPEALRGFSAMNIVEWEQALGQAMGFFGPKYPREQEERRKALPSPVKSARREVWDPFYELDERFYDWLKPDQDRWNRVADNYATDTAA